MENMNKFNKLVEAYAPGFSGVRSFQKGDIVKLPKGWQRERGYHADWAKDVNLGEVWGHVIDRNIHMTGDVEVTLLDPYTREPLGQGLAFRPDELRLAESVVNEISIHDWIFPRIKNEVWTLGEEDEEFVAWMSDLDQGGRNKNLKDPWFRPLPKMLEHINKEGEITMWSVKVSIGNQIAQLRVFND